MKGETKKSSAFRKEYRGRENLSRGTTSVRRHLTATTFSGTDIPKFCNGNARCILLRISPIQRTANRMNSRRTSPLPRTNRQFSVRLFPTYWFLLFAFVVCIISPLYASVNSFSKNIQFFAHCMHIRCFLFLSVARKDLFDSLLFLGAVFGKKAYYRNNDSRNSHCAYTHLRRFCRSRAEA